MIVAWKVMALNPSIASTRYRCFLPAHRLTSLGCKSRIYAGSESIDFAEKPAVVVFEKSFTDHDVELARKARAAGIPVVIDLCDNIFHRAKFPVGVLNADKLLEAVEGFRAMAQYASAIVVTGAELQNVVLQETASRVPVFIIPDPLEEESDLKFSMSVRGRTKRDYLFDHGLGWFVRVGIPWSINFFLMRLVSSLNPVRLLEPRPKKMPLPDNSSDITESLITKTVLWFGNAGIEGVFGMTDLIPLRASLEDVNAEMPTKLVVISNSRAAFDQHIRPFGLPTLFVQWSPQAVKTWLKKSDAVIVPNPLNGFSICKSANRALLALQSGAPVVATMTSALTALSGCIKVENWTENILSYLRDPMSGKRDAQRAQEVIRSEFAPEQMAVRWKSLIASLKNSSSRS